MRRVPAENLPTIQSAQNPKIKSTARLRDASQRRKTGLFLIDGQAEIERALRYGVRLQTVYVEAGRQYDFGDLPTPPFPVQPVEPALMPRIAYGQRERGPIAVAFTPALTLDRLRGTVGNLLILDRTEKPGNLGACLRTASACGVAGVILTDPVCEVFNPNTIRASRGSVFTLPIATATPSEAQAFCRELQLPMLAARVDGERPFWELDLSAPAAMVFGSEADGLGDNWRGRDVTSFRIPMHSATDSLNLSISAAVSLYELVRQQRSVS